MEGWGRECLGFVNDIILMLYHTLPCSIDIGKEVATIELCCTLYAKDMYLTSVIEDIWFAVRGGKALCNSSVEYYEVVEKVIESK